MKPLLAALLLAAPLLSFAADCEWRNPGANPYKGSVADALARYPQIPAGVRKKLADKMRSLKNYDDVVRIGREEIHGKDGRYSRLRDMHFGTGKICRGDVARKSWRMDQSESALIFRVEGWTIAYPSVCRNVSLIDGPANKPELMSEPPSSGGGGTFGGLPPVLAETLVEPLLLAPVESRIIVELPPTSFASIALPYVPFYYISVVPQFTAAVPELSTWMLLFLGVVLLYVWRRNR